MALNDKQTIAELRKCRAQLVRLIKGDQQIGGKSKEVCTSEAALKAIEEQIEELRARKAQKHSWPYPLKRA